MLQHQRLSVPSDLCEASLEDAIETLKRMLPEMPETCVIDLTVGPMYAFTADRWANNAPAEVHGMAIVHTINHTFPDFMWSMRIRDCIVWSDPT